MILALADQILISLLAFAAVALAILASRGAIDAYFRARKERGLLYQQQLHLTAPPSGSVWGAPLLAIGAFLFFWLLANPLVALVAAVVVYLLVDGMPKAAVARRSRRFDAQLVDALTGLSNSLKAGLTLAQAVEQVAKNSPSPMSEEFALATREYGHGKTIEQSFEAIGDRVKSDYFELVVAAFRVGKERGGNIAQVFEKISSSIREIWRLEEQVRTMSTQGKSSARIMSFMPAVFLVLLYIMDPEGIKLLFIDPIGQVMLTVIVLINIIGHIWIRRIMAVEL